MDPIPLVVAGSMGLVIAAIGLLLRRTRRADRVCLARLQSTTAVRIADADAAPGAAVEITGRACATDGGLMPAPISGRPVLCSRLDVMSREGSASRYRLIYVQRDLRDFIIEDDSARRARLVFAPKQAGLLIDADVIGDRLGLISRERHLGPATEEHRRWLARRFKGEVPLLRDLRFEERVVEPGQAVTALGWSQADPTSQDLKVTSIGAADGEDLLLFTTSKAELVARLQQGQRLAWVFLGAGVAAILLGLTLSFVLA